MTDKEAMKLALEALENHCGNYKLDDAGCDRHEKATTALKEALAQPEQKPMHPEFRKMLEDYFDKCFAESAPQRTWVGLTKTAVGNHLRRHALGDQPTFRQGFKEGVVFAEAKLKEKNSAT